MRIRELLKVNSLKKSYFKRTATAALASVLMLSIVGCGSDENTDGKKNTAASDGVTIVRVGSGASYNPYCYLDENGNAVGYEYDVLSAIDEKLPQYEFQYDSLEFDQLLISLDTGKLDFIAHQYEATDERREKYLFSDESYTVFNTYITVLADNEDIASLDDLQGKKVWAGGTTSAANSILLNYNKEHPDNPIQIINDDDLTAEHQVTNLTSGAWAASICMDRDVAGFNDEYRGEDGKDVLKTVGDPVNTSLTYYLFNTDETELKDAVDGALRELKEEGTLEELSEKWLGGDYTGE